MKWAVYALLGAWGYAAGAGCRSLEMHTSGESKSGEGREIPLYLAFPDSLGSLAVRPFLEAPPDKAGILIRNSEGLIRSLTPAERNFLKALRDLVDGHGQEAAEALAALSKHPPARLRSGLRVDRALLAYLAGFTDAAEKEWLGVVKTGSECEEMAGRNLYSLYLGRKDFAKAEALVDDLLRSDPKDKWAIAAKGSLLRMLMAGEDWERFLRDKSSWKDSLFDVQIAYGKFLKEQGRLEEARKYYNRGLEGSPRNGPAWLELADIQYRLGYYVFAETCLRNAFSAGVDDPYIFELYGRVLTGLSTYAADGGAMRELGFGWDAAWAARCWSMAERILEDGFPHDLHSRSMAQLLYHLYCHNGRVEAAGNLRSDFWFHFEGSPAPKQARLGDPLPGFPSPPRASLAIKVGYVAFPLITAAAATDFFEPF